MRLGRRPQLIGLAVILLVVAVGHWHASHSAEAAGAIRDVAVSEKVVALTYDDGPHPVYTPELLRILDSYGVKATFFVIGSRVEQHPDIVREMLAKGHVLGNHTYSHPANLELESRGEVMVELIRCESQIWQATGTRTDLFRPPKGLANEQVVRTASDFGYGTVLWTVCADHHDAITPAMMAQRVLSRVTPGCIILAHDGMYPMRWRDVAATPLIIEGLRKQGYRFVTVPELLALRHSPPTETAGAARAKRHSAKQASAKPPRKSHPAAHSAAGRGGSA